MRNAKIWTLWGLATIVSAAFVFAGMIYGGSIRAQLLPGKTTSGHHQIELACDACHTTPLGGGAVLQTACVKCHAAELKEARDTHPAKKFTDPRNADRLSLLRADLCVTCHREHRPEITRPMGVSLPGDFCQLCHQDIAKERPSHAGLAFSTCGSAGCHNFHDNRALYEDFLGKHARDPATRLRAFVKLLQDPPEAPPESAALTLAQADAPAGKTTHAGIAGDWMATSHAKAGVNCSGCHAPDTKKGEPASLAQWSDHPSDQVCASCHGIEAKGFVAGRHGMRLAPGLKSESAGLFGLFTDRPLPPMRPELARLPMSPQSHGREIGCSTCHSAHRFDTAKAPVDSCLGCHADTHSTAYRQSSHYKLWQAEIAGTKPRGSGVSCATCHMPRVSREDASGIERVVANHNQNDNLRPNDKMIRSVCLDCHGLGFALDALADRDLVQRNFSGSPSVHVESIDWAVKRLDTKKE